MVFRALSPRSKPRELRLKQSLRTLHHRRKH